MKITEFFCSDRKEYWLKKIRSCGWAAGEFLYELVTGGNLKSSLGKNTRIFLLTDCDELVSFCTLSDVDDIQPTELTPWIGFVFTAPEYRGNRRVGKLIRHAEDIAASQGFKNTYISTDHTGLYEKYGYHLLCTAKDVHGEDSRIYTKEL